VAKISQRFIDSSFNEWRRGLEKKLNVLERMTVNIVERCNIDCIAAFIKHSTAYGPLTSINQTQRQHLQ